MKYSLTRAFALTALAAMASATSVNSLAADLVVEVSGVQSAEGVVFAALYDSAAQMKSDQRFKVQQVEAAKRTPDGKVHVTFSNLPGASYAVAVFHDRDNNGKLTTNFMGMPTEPYGFSNNAVGSFGPPSFEAAAFAIAGDKVQTSITVK
jgi:uncharacterized protein (DUF2141 family)